MQVLTNSDASGTGTATVRQREIVGESTGAAQLARLVTAEPAYGGETARESTSPIGVLDEQGYENPGEATQRAARGTSDDYYGAFSIETFADAGGLSYTHEDAQGWYNYVAQFQTPNFWYKDGNVKPWAYYEDYDNWQDTYGIDAVLAAYHSGHGTMDGNGVFYAPLGGSWGSLGSWVRSDQMRIGNEQANYIFWSTCLSCRVHDGQSPMRTWQPANLGFRMLFGFETVSWDDPNYGKYFWEEWNKNKSLSSAWLDASWRIAHDQAPAVVACGATQAEASSRVFNERFFSWAHVNTSWWWWRWYDAARSGRGAILSRRPNLRMPSEVMSARLAAPGSSSRRISSLVNALGMDIRVPRNISVRAGGEAAVGEGSARLIAGPDGSFRAQMREANRENRTALDAQKAMRIATDFTRGIRLDNDTEVAFDVVRVSNEAGASDRGTGRVENTTTSETTIQFRQMIDGIPVITPGAGELRVSVDNDGAVTSVESSLRSVERMMRRPRAGDPPEPGRPSSDIGRGPEVSVEDRLSRAWGRTLAARIGKGDIPGNFSVVPGSTEIGYAINGNRAELVAQQAVEVDFGYGLKKRYWVTAPLGE